jgi:hypothetical protein
MPGYAPASSFPFAVNFLTCVVQIYFIIMGDIVSFNARISVGFAGVALILIVFPWLA